jgi:hypothetical protein
MLFRDSVVDPLATALAAEAFAATARARTRLASRIHDATERAVRYLVESQTADGGFPRSPGSWTQEVHSLSLFGLALLAAGARPGEGSAGIALESAIRRLLRIVPPAGRLPASHDSKREDASYETWLASFASLCLCEARRLDADLVPMRTLRSLARRLALLQKESGGWCHDLAPKVRTTSFGTHHYSDDLVVASAFALGALARLREAGVDVEAAVFDRARAYFERTRNGDGGWKYGLGHVWSAAEDSERGRTAVTVWALPLAFGKRAFELDASLRYLEAGMPELPLSPGHGNRPFLVNYVSAALAARAHPTGLLDAFRQKLALPLLDLQRPDGSFSHATSLWEGPLENTAVAVLVLAAAAAP